MTDTVTYLKGDTLFKSDRLHLVQEHFATPDGDQSRAVIHHPGAVAIIAQPQPGSLLMVRQYRYALRRETLEIPAGTIDPNEDPLITAGRELIEETGYAAADLEEVFRLYPAVGFSDELQYFYRAQELTPAAMNPDAGELIAPEILDESAIQEAIRAGLICDAKTLLALQFVGMHWVEALQS